MPTTTVSITCCMHCTRCPLPHFHQTTNASPAFPHQHQAKPKQCMHIPSNTEVCAASAAAATPLLGSKPPTTPLSQLPSPLPANGRAETGGWDAVATQRRSAIGCRGRASAVIGRNSAIIRPLMRSTLCCCFCFVWGVSLVTSAVKCGGELEGLEGALCNTSADSKVMY